MLPAIHGLLRWIFVINIFRQGSRYSIAYNNANLYIQECLTMFSICLFCILVSLYTSFLPHTDNDV